MGKSKTEIINEIDFYSKAIELSDYKKIDKLLKLNNINTYWDDVRKLTKNVYSDHSINRWEALSDFRYSQLLKMNNL